MLLKNSEFPLKVKFSDEAFQNIFVGVAGDNQSRVLEVTILDLDNNIYKEEVPSFKILAKGDLDKKVYYNVGTKKSPGVYTVEIPSQVFKQSQNVEIQFLIENEETHERIFSPMIKQRVQRGFCANFEEGTNIYLDYEEILKFEENFDDFLKLISQDKDAILLEMIKVKDDNKEEIVALKGDFINTSKEAVDAANKAKDEAIAATEGVKEEIQDAAKSAVEEIKGELTTIKTDTVAEMNKIKDETVKQLAETGKLIGENLDSKANEINAALTGKQVEILKSISDKETQTIKSISDKEVATLASIDAATLKSQTDIANFSTVTLEEFKTSSIQEKEKAIEDLKSAIEQNKLEALQEIVTLKESSLREIATLKTGAIDGVNEALTKALGDINTSKTDSLEAIEVATKEAIESIKNEAGEAVIPPQVLEDIKNKATKQELEDGLKTKAEKEHKHVAADIEGLEDFKLEDTSIKVVAKDKMLNIVLADLESADSTLTEAQTNLKKDIDGKALKVHAHTTTDITGLDELISGIELKDTNIDVVSQSKKLDVVLAAMGRDILNNGGEIYTMKPKVSNLESAQDRTNTEILNLLTTTSNIENDMKKTAPLVHTHKLADVENSDSLATKGQLQTVSSKVSNIEDELGIYSERITAVADELNSLI